ncbi:hypothetical protein BJ138DRAFT_996574 [Hygrophoropsis aurantiaca]|uniref:Uncharacterized protein n=1 Tax=Hygrophoropsis aurantiaca TaxID=72124 RepID=A0ACB8ARG9_9AGAM|nr:hypothetical protein BJ138DRAFT_996574 [Hygrophoropsis aurantiaca]
MVLENHPDPPRGARRARDRDPAQPTDFAERIIALQRRNAAAARPRERVERPPPSPRPLPPTPNPPPPPIRNSPVISSPRKNHQSPQTVGPRIETDPEDFSRRLKISSPPRQSHQKQQQHPNRLFNPDTDPIPMRKTAEPESISDAASSSYVPRSAAPPTHQRDHPAVHQRLFDHRKDDPVRFSVLARPSSTNGARPTPTPKSSGDYVSASSTSSYAHSIASSFTLSSGTTDNSSASSALFEGKPREDSSNNAFAVQLKKLYRNISTLESKIIDEDADENADEGRVLLHGRGREANSEELEQQKWVKLIADHKQLAELMHTLMEISLAASPPSTPPSLSLAASVPASLRVIPTKYNIIIRLWTHAFYKLLETLRRASFNSPLALEHLQDFIYFAYTFYTGLLEEPALHTFKAGWLEALGDIARYRMAVAAIITNKQITGAALTADAVSQAAADSEEAETSKPESEAGVQSSGDRPVARIDDSPSPSVGIAAARLLEVEPEKERWRGIAREWYAQGLADTPGTGKLHHHLGLLSREVESEALRAVYHFVKSMTTLHPFSTSRESILPIWSSTAQARRSLPDARASELFVLLHGMLFTNIQLDDFQPTLAHFLERLEIEGAEQRDWIMMEIINIGGILEYGKPNSLLKKSSGPGIRDPSAVRVVAKRGLQHDIDDDKQMDVDDETGKPTHQDIPSIIATQASPAMSEAGLAVEHPVSLKFAMELAFLTLSFVLRHPSRKPSPFARSTLNPYLTILLTFLSTVSKHADILSVLERSIPWDDLAQFFSTIPRNVLSLQGLLVPVPNGERWPMLTSECAPPLPEDWSLRGMEWWVGRKVFERGYWKSGDERRMEVEVLDLEENNQLTDGIIEDEDDDEDATDGRSGAGDTNKRWARIARCAVGLSQNVEGFVWADGTRHWRVEGALEMKMRKWREEDRQNREVEERRRLGRRWTDDAMEVDTGGTDEADESSDDDEEDSEEVKALKARRRYLRSLLASPQRGPSQVPTQPARTSRSRKNAPPAPSLNIIAGYTNLVLDTNILLSSLSAVSSIIESMRWTVVLPVPVIMELDGLSSNTSPLGEAAQEAVAYITSHIRSHSTSLKVQTSKGNYLTSLSIRTERVDLTDEDSWDRCMDDLILKAAIWQDEHWVDRSALLKPSTSPRDVANAVKVVLLSLDRNLRLKARSRQLAAASEKDLAALLSNGT